MSLALFLAFAAFRGVIDPWYDQGGRESSVRLTWRVDSGDQQAEIVSTLTRGKFAVAINFGFGIVVAQKPIDTNEIDIALEWAVKKFPHLLANGAEWYGAEPIFRGSRSPLEMSHRWIVGGHKQQPEKSRKTSPDLPENPFWSRFGDNTKRPGSIQLLPGLFDFPTSPNHDFENYTIWTTEIFMTYGLGSLRRCRRKSFSKAVLGS